MDTKEIKAVFEELGEVLEKVGKIQDATMATLSKEDKKKVNDQIKKSGIKEYAEKEMEDFKRKFNL